MPSTATHESSPLVTVVIPTHNREDLIVPTIDSVRRQTLQQWECIVVDDGSTDHTREVVEAICRAEPRLRYVWQENSSAANARNHGLRLANGRYIVFLDSDDLFTPDRLEWQAAALEADPGAVIAYGDTWKFYHDKPHDGFLYLDGTTSMPQGDAFEALISNSSMYSPLIRTAAIREAGGFDVEIASAEDWDMWLTLARKGRVIYEPRVALHYRIHSGNKSANTLRNYRCASYVVKKHLKDLPDKQRRRLRRQARDYFQKGYTYRLFDLSRDSIRQGRLLIAARAAGTAIFLNPGTCMRTLALQWPRRLVAKILSWPLTLINRLVSSPRGILRLTHRPPADTRSRPSPLPPLNDVARILIIRQDEIGDVVMTSALLRELRRNAPAAEITMVANPVAAALLEACPYIDRVLPLKWNERGRIGPIRRWRQARDFAREHLQPRDFDLAIIPRYDCDDYFSTALACLSGATHRLAYSEAVTPRKQRRNRDYDLLLTHAMVTSSAHDVEHNLNLLRQLGGQVHNDRLELWTTEADQAFAANLLSDLGIDNDSPLVVIAPGAGAAKRQWPIEQLAEVAAWLMHDQNAQVIIIGGPDERHLGRELRRQAGNGIIDLVGHCSLRQTAALLRHCNLYVGNDSGPMHMAVAAGLPIVEISCHPEAASLQHPNSPSRFGPWQVPCTILRPPAPLAPCTDGCEADRPHCIRQITPDQVKQAAQAFLPAPVTLHR